MKFRRFGRTTILWLLFATWLTPVRGFSTPCSERGADTIRCWEVSYQLPVYGQQGHVDTSIRAARQLYINGDLMMYVYSYGWSTGVDGEQTSSGTGFEYYVFQKDSLSGMLYDDHRPERTGSFAVDSLKRSVVPYLKQYDLFKKGPGRLVSAVSHTGSGQLVETYCDINIGEHPNLDSCYVTYSDALTLLPREMSLDYTLDSLYQKKLCEFKLIINPGLDKKTNHRYDRSEWIFKLEEVSNFKRDTIQSWFSRYRLDVRATRP